jgi:hypothetical protein
VGDRAAINIKSRGAEMKKTHKDTNRTQRLRFSSETIRELRPSDLRDVAGGTSNEGAEAEKRPT